MKGYGGTVVVNGGVFWSRSFSTGGTPPPLRSTTLFRRLAMRLMREAAERGRERRKQKG